LRVVFVRFSPRREPRGVNGCGVRVCDNGGSGEPLPSREARRAGGRSSRPTRHDIPAPDG
jgi:hypothetical protein